MCTRKFSSVLKYHITALFYALQSAVPSSK